VNFSKGLQRLKDEDAMKRQPEPSKQPASHQGRKTKVSVTQWVDPAVRKQIQQLALDHEKDQYVLVNEALKLLFEKYGKPPIA
jgi:hypothetical protein